MYNTCEFSLNFVKKQLGKTWKNGKNSMCYVKSNSQILSKKKQKKNEYLLTLIAGQVTGGCGAFRFLRPCFLIDTPSMLSHRLILSSSSKGFVLFMLVCDDP